MKPYLYLVPCFLVSFIATGIADHFGLIERAVLWARSCV